LVKQESTQGAARCQLSQSSVSNGGFSVCNEGLTGLCAKDCAIILWRFRLAKDLALRFMRGHSIPRMRRACWVWCATSITVSLLTRCCNNTLVVKKLELAVFPRFTSKPQLASPTCLSSYG